MKLYSKALIFLAVPLAYLAYLLITTQPDSTPPIETPSLPLSFEQRLDSAFKAHATQMEGSTSDRVQAIYTIVEQFLPEAAAKVSKQEGISTQEATQRIKAKMLAEAARAEDEYIAENGYGTIIRDLKSGEALGVIYDILATPQPKLSELQ